jgi:hypothetical protein
LLFFALFEAFEGERRQGKEGRRRARLDCFLCFLFLVFVLHKEWALCDFVHFLMIVNSITSLLSQLDRFFTIHRAEPSKHLNIFTTSSIHSTPTPAHTRITRITPPSYKSYSPPSHHHLPPPHNPLLHNPDPSLFRLLGSLFVHFWITTTIITAIREPDRLPDMLVFARRLDQCG